MSFQNAIVSALPAALASPAAGGHVPLADASPIGSPAAAGGPVQVGYGVSLSDFSSFQQSLAQAAQRIEARPVAAPNEAAKQLMQPFEHINGEAQRIAQDAKVAESQGRDLSPSEMVNLTVRSSEFMFHCQLMSNIANRTSDGLSQLFRQQS